MPSKAESQPDEAEAARDNTDEEEEDMVVTSPRNKTNQAKAPQQESMGFEIAGAVQKTSKIKKEKRTKLSINTKPVAKVFEINIDVAGARENRSGNKTVKNADKQAAAT